MMFWVSNLTENLLIQAVLVYILMDTPGIARPTDLEAEGQAVRGWSEDSTMQGRPVIIHRKT